MAGRIKINHRPQGHNLVGVHPWVAHVVMALDVVHIAGGFKGGLLVEIAQVAPEVGIVNNAVQVALEVDVVDRIKPIEGGKEANIGFGEAIATQVALAIEHRFPMVEGGKQVGHRLVVGGLLGGKPGPVNAIVNGLVDGVNGAVDLGLEVSGVEINGVGHDGIPLGIEHANDFAGISRSKVGGDVNGYPSITAYAGVLKIVFPEIRFLPCRKCHPLKIKCIHGCSAISPTPVYLMIQRK